MFLRIGRVRVIAAGVALAGCFNPSATEETSGTSTTAVATTTVAPTSGVPTSGGPTSGTEIGTSTGTTAVVTATSMPTTGTCPNGCETSSGETTATSESTSGETTEGTTGADGLGFNVVPLPAFSGAYAVVAADLDGTEEFDDIVVSSDMLTSFAYYYGGDLVLHTQDSGVALALAPFDRVAPSNDSVVMGFTGPAQIGLYSMVGNWSAATITLPMACGEPVAVSAADVNGDTYVDVVVACAEYKAGVFLAKGSVNGFDPVVVQVMLGTEAVALALVDVVGMEVPDLITVSTATGEIQLRENPGDGVFPAMWTQSYPVEGADRLALAKVNGDDYLDVAVIQRNGPACALLPGDLAGLTAPSTLGCGELPRDIAFGDVDGDGKPDVLTIHDAELHVMLNMGPGFGGPQVFAGPLDPQRMAVGNFYGDARLDVVVTSGSGLVSLLVQE